MKVFNTGDVFRGKNYTDMINKALGTRFSFYRKCTVDLDRFNCPGVVAWFVFMDGSFHGYEEGWVWANRISLDGLSIKEFNVSTQKERLKERKLEIGYQPYRLAFQIDPYENQNRYCCKFVGAFRFREFIREDGTAYSYEKVLDRFALANNGETGNFFNTKEDLQYKGGKFLTSIDDMGFSSLALHVLKNGKVKNAGELLELGLGFKGDLADEISEKVIKFFS